MENTHNLSQPMPIQDNPSTPKESTEDLLALAQQLRWQIGRDFHEQLVEATYADAARIAERAVWPEDQKPRFDLDRTIDQIVTHKFWGFPVMLALFAMVFWLTITGANYPSQYLSHLLLDIVYPFLSETAAAIGLPTWLSGFLIDGVYLSTAWVVSVMLPPMAIFFPLFTLLEDFGYLPRVAFNLDHLFKRAGAHGKQALTMMMGFGCNAAGIVATRIIDSPRERLIAMITNNFALCNGRWPTQILIATLFIGALVPSVWAGLISAGAVLGVALLGVLFSLLVSWSLSRSVLKGQVSTFSLELPPYRPPRLLQTIYTSIIDRTLYVLWRAIVFAAPAGGLLWLLSNIQLGGQSLAEHMVNFANPLGILLGLNGVILVAYVIAIPANELVIPTILMLTVLTTGLTGFGAGAGVMFEAGQADTLAVLQTGGWTLLTAVSLMLFSLVHNPCSTTLFTMYKETGSLKWTAVAAFLPLGMGFLLTFFVAQVWRLLGGM
jgi:ferrous iron transport protein B